MKAKKEKTPMELLTQGYEKLIKGKEVQPNGKHLFEKALVKASTSKKPHGSK